MNDTDGIQIIKVARPFSEPFQATVKRLSNCEFVLFVYRYVQYKVSEYSINTMCYCHFVNGRQFCEFLFASLGDKTLQ